jgi:hypothetical protein
MRAAEVFRDGALLLSELSEQPTLQDIVNSYRQASAPILIHAHTQLPHALRTSSHTPIFPPPLFPEHP